MNSATANLAHPSTQSVDFYNLLLISQKDGWKVLSLHGKDADGNLLDISGARQVGKTLTGILEVTEEGDGEHVLADVQKAHPGVTISQVQFISSDRTRVITLHISGSYMARNLKAAA